MLAITNAKIITIEHDIVESGTILIQDGKIIELGERVDVSNCNQVIDAQGRVLTPGLIDAHTHVGLTESGVGREGIDTNEGTNPLTPFCSVRDGINLKDQAFQEFRKAGITTVGILPGSGNILGGTGLAIKCKGLIVDQAILKDPVGIKVALGENPKGHYGAKKQSPATRMGNAALLRNALQKAKDYAAQEEPKYDVQSEALLPVLDGTLPLIIHAHRHDDLVTAIRICREFNLKYVLEHVTDGHLILDLLRKENVHCAVGPTLRYGSKVENRDRDFQTPIGFAKAGIPFCFTTDHPVINGKNLLLTASISTQWGLSDAEALRAITLASAEHLGLEQRVGSLAVGKDADLVLWSDHPLELTTFVDLTIIDGEIVYQREGQVC